MTEQNNEVKIIVSADTKPAEQSLHKFKKEFEDGAKSGQKFGSDINDGLNKSLKNIKIKPSTFSGIMSAVSSAVIAAMNIGFANVVKSQALSAKSNAVNMTIQTMMQEKNAVIQEMANGVISPKAGMEKYEVLSGHIEKLTDKLDSVFSELNSVVDEANDIASKVQDPLFSGGEDSESSADKEAADTSEKRVKAEKDISKAKKENEKSTKKTTVLEESLITRMARRLGLHEDMLKGIKDDLTTTEGIQRLTIMLKNDVKGLFSLVINGVKSLATAHPILLAITVAILVIKALVGQIKKIIDRIISAFKTIYKIASKAMQITVKALAEIAKVLAKLSIAELKVVSKQITTLFNVAVSGINSVYKLAKKLFSLWSISFSSAIGTMYAWAKVNKTEVSNSLDEITSCIYSIQNALAVMVMPIIKAITPLVKTITDNILVLANSVSKLFAIMAGKSSYTKVTKSAKDFADANSEASKSLQKLLLNIDELQKLDDNSANAFDSFVESEEKLDNIDLSKFDLGVSIGEKIANFFTDIPWNSIKQKASEIGTNLSNIINGILNVDGLGEKFGNTLAEAVNTAFGFLSSFINNFDAAALGQQLSGIVTGLFNGIDFQQIYNAITGLASNIVETFNTFIEDKERVQSVVNAISNLFKTAVDSVATLLEGLNIRALGQNITDEINAIFSQTEEIQRLCTSILNFLGNSFRAVLQLINDLDIESVMTAIIGSINNFLNDGERVQEVADGIFNLFNKACSIVTSTIKNLDWNKLVENVTTYIKKAITGLSGQDIADALMTLFDAGINLAIKMPWKELAQFGCDVVNRIITEFPKVFSTSSAQNIANSFAEVFNTIVDAIQPDKIGAAVNQFVQWVKTFWITIKEKVDWRELVDKVCEAVRSVNWGEALKVVWQVIWDCIQFKFIFGVNFFDTLVSDICSDIVNCFSGAVKGLVTALGKLIEYGLTWFNPFAAIVKAAQTAISAVKRIFSGSGISMNVDSSNSFSTFASGGVVTKPTAAIVGEYAGASSNPEIITPENKMREVFAEGNSNLANVYISVGRQIISAIENQNLEVSIGDDVIAKSASRGNKNYYKMTGQSLFA